MSSFSRLLLASLYFGAAVAAAAATTPEEFAAAQSLYNQRQNEAAQAAFSRLAAADPQNAAAFFYLGLLALRNDDPKTAASQLEHAVELAPKECDYRCRLGDAYAMLAQRASLFSKPGLAKKCQHAYEAAIAVDPKHVGAHWSLMEYYKQAPGVLGGSMAKAYEEVDVITRLDAIGGRWARALLLLKEEKAAAALALYDDELHSDAPSYAALFQFGRLTQWSGLELPRGQEALHKCLALSPAAAWAGGHQEVHYALGRIHERLGDAAAARTEYQAALVVDPAYKPAQDALAKLG